MKTSTGTFRILVATDDSAQARAAIATLRDDVWPVEARVRAVVARESRPPHSRSVLLTALDRTAEETAASARRALLRRSPDAEAIVVDGPPIKGVLKEAKRFRADLIIVGWRGHGAVRRLLMGSVSRGIVRGAKCPVLVVRDRAPRIQEIVVGFDGSRNARRAVKLIASLVAPRGGRVTLVSIAEPQLLRTSGPRVGGIRSTISQEINRIKAERSESAISAMNKAAEELKHSGWNTRTLFKIGEPLRELMTVVGTVDPQLLVVGARGTSGVRHLLLGSVAEGVLNLSPVPVLLAQ